MAKKKSEVAANLEKVDKAHTNLLNIATSGDISNLTESELLTLRSIVEATDLNHPALRRLDDRLSELRTAAFEAENNLQTNESSVYTDNAEAIDEISEGYSYENMLDADKDIKEVVGNFVVTDEVETEGGVVNAPVKPETKNAYLKLLFEAAKKEAALSLYGNEEFHKQSKEEKAKTLREEANDVYMSRIATIKLGSVIEKPKGKECEIGSEEFRAYTKRQADQARLLFSSSFKGGKSNVKVSQILASVADTASNVDNYVGALRQKADKLTGEARHSLKSLEARITSGWKKVEETANHISNNRYEIFRNVKKSVRAGFHDNKIQTITGLAAVIAMRAGMAASVPWALGAYGAYMAASGYVMPIIAEMRKLKREAKEENREPLSFKERLKMAIHKKWDKTIVNEQGQEIENPERKKYLRRARITAGIGLVGFTGLAGLTASGAAVAGKAVANTWLLRTGAPITAQGVDLRFAKKRRREAKAALKESDNEKTQKEFLGAQQEVNNARLGFYLGLALSGGSQGMSHALQNSGVMEQVSETLQGMHIFGNGAEVADNMQDVVSNSDWPKMDTPNWEVQDAEPVMLRGVNVEVSVDSSDISNLDESQLKLSAEAIEPMPNDAELFPREYSQDLGITQKQYNILMSRLPGIMKDFDDVSLDRAYLNMNDEFMANFEGKTKMEVFYETLALARNSRRSQVVLGNAESGFYVNTPTERVAITDEGIIEQAKQALANGDKVYISRLHGREFLRGQFENLKLDGMNDEKMSKIVEIAMKTYDSSEVGNATNQIREVFPDLSKAEVSKISEIVNYNRRFEANGKTLESIFNAIGCGEKIEDGKAANDLIDNAQAILRQSKGPARIVGQNVECNDTVVHIIGGKKVVQTVVDERYTPTTKAMKANISESKAEVDVKLDKTKDIPPLPERQGARHGIINNQKQIYDGTAKLDGRGRFIQEDATGTRIATKLENQR